MKLTIKATLTTFKTLVTFFNLATIQTIFKEVAVKAAPLLHRLGVVANGIVQIVLR